MVLWAVRLSSQKPGCWDCSDSRVISDSRLGKSKTHPDLVDAGAYALDDIA